MLFKDVFIDVTKKATKLKTSDYQESGKYPVVDQGQKAIAGYTDLEDGLFTDVPAIIFGDHTRVIKYIDTPFFIGADGVKVIKHIDQNIDYKYLYYLLSSVRIPNTGYNRHYKWLKESVLPEHNHSQKAIIVNTLSLIDSLIKKQNEYVLKFDELVKSRFVEMFGNPITNSHNLPLKTLSELGELGRGISKHRPRNAPELLGGVYPLIQTGDVANASLYILDYNSTYSETGFKQSKMWSKGTLCITIAANIAKTAILTFDSCFPDSVVGFNANVSTNNIFIHFWFSFFQEILEEQAPESAQKNINLKILSELKVIVPPIELQQQFADFVAQTDKSKLAVQKSIDKLEILKKSLMQEYFG